MSVDLDERLSVVAETLADSLAESWEEADGAICDEQISEAAEEVLSDICAAIVARLTERGIPSEAADENDLETIRNVGVAKARELGVNVDSLRQRHPWEIEE